MKSFFQLFVKLTFLGSQPEALFLWNSNSDWLGGIFSFVYKTTFLHFEAYVPQPRLREVWTRMAEKRIIVQGWDG